MLRLGVEWCPSASLTNCVNSEGRSGQSPYLPPTLHPGAAPATSANLSLQEPLPESGKPFLACAAPHPETPRSLFTAGKSRGPCKWLPSGSLARAVLVPGQLPE